MSNAGASNDGQQKTNPQKSTEIWNRVGHVEITAFQGTGSKTFNFDGLDFKFEVSTILGRVPEGNMSVSICGLSQDTANQLITICNVRQALAERKTLKLYAGYADPENEHYKGDLIAAMDIVNASITTPPPDIWLQITGVYAAWLNDRMFAVDVMNLSEAKDNADIKREATSSESSWALASEKAKTDKNALLTNFRKEKKLNYVPIEMALQEICKGLNAVAEKIQRKTKYTYDISRVQPKRKSFIKGKTKRFEFKGSLAELPTKVSEYYKVLAMWEERDDNTICLAVYPDPKHVPYLSEQEKVYVEGATIKFLDVDHGLIGIPKLKDSIKLECRCYLDSKIKAGDYVSVKSEMMPQIYEYGQNIKPSNKTLANQWGSSRWRKDKDTGKTVAEDQDTIKAYQIMKIKYRGHLRGNEWFCDIEARRPDIIAERIDEVKPRAIWLTEDAAGKLKQLGWEYDPKTGDMKKMLNKK